LNIIRSKAQVVKAMPPITAHMDASDGTVHYEGAHFLGTLRDVGGADVLDVEWRILAHQDDIHDRAVIKPLDRMAGKSVFVIGVDDPNRSVLLETMTDFGSRYIMAQRYLPEVVADGDARILLIDGEPIPDALVRYAPTGDHRANMSVGARTEVRPLTDAERRVCGEVGPVVRDMGLVFVGIDVIGGYLTEINVTSPTGIRELDGACGINIAAQLLDTIVTQLRDT